MTKRIALYCRVSTDKQDTSNQTFSLKEHIARHPDWELKTIYEEQASGGDDSRPVLAKLVKDGHKGEFDVLLVHRLDRLGRSTIKILTVLSDLASAGISFVSASEGFDTTTPHGRLLLQFLSAISEYERSLIRSRIKTSLDRIRKEGLIQLGRPRVGFDIGKAIELKNSGLGYRRIGKKLGVSHATVYRSLQAVSKTSLPKTPVSVS